MKFLFKLKPFESNINNIVGCKSEAYKYKKKKHANPSDSEINNCRSIRTSDLFHTFLLVNHKS